MRGPESSRYLVNLQHIDGERFAATEELPGIVWHSGCCLLSLRWDVAASPQDADFLFEAQMQLLHLVDRLEV